MPILPPEPNLSPANLFQDSAGSAAGRVWWCLHAKPRQEKATARFLRSRELAYFLPQIVHTGTTPGGRRFQSSIPLFPGYLFLLANERERVESFAGQTLVGILRVPEQDQFAAQIAQIHRILEAGVPVRPEPSLPVGAQCRILNGPLQGLVGTVIGRSKPAEFAAVIQFLGQGATIHLHDWEVEPVTP